mgnify:CR=1 FL=1|jgi:hypothetical protein
MKKIYRVNLMMFVEADSPRHALTVADDELLRMYEAASSAYRGASINNLSKPKLIEIEDDEEGV